MKKILIILALLSYIITGCEKGLEPEIYGDLLPMTFPATEEEFELYTLEVYVPFSSKWPYGDGGTKYHFFGLEEGHIQMLDAPTDIIATFPGWGWDRITGAQFDVLIGLGRDRSHFEKTRFVTRCTQIIADLEEATLFEDEEFQNQLIAEAKMARGWTMYRMLQMFGPVPVIIDPELIGNKEAESDLTVPDHDFYVNTIVEDLEFASEHLEVAPTDYGRFNQGLALTVLMRLYLNEKDFVNAEAVGRDIMDMGYTLVDDYNSLFKEGTEVNTETIYAISCTGTSQGRGPDGNFNAYRWYCFPFDHPNFGGWAGPNETPFMASWEFYYSFDPADERRNGLIGSYLTSDSTVKDSSNLNGAIINKYPVEGTTAYQGNDIVLARQADVMLMLAEAINENSGPTPEAIALVNNVRSRAGIGALQADETASKDAFNDAILQERAWELYFEGFRLWDLRRHDKWPSAVEGMQGKENASPSSYFPIPQYAVDDGMTQRPEYLD